MTRCLRSAHYVLGAVLRITGVASSSRTSVLRARTSEPREFVRLAAGHPARQGRARTRNRVVCMAEATLVTLTPSMQQASGPALRKALAAALIKKNPTDFTHWDGSFFSLHFREEEGNGFLSLLTKTPHLADGRRNQAWW